MSDAYETAEAHRRIANLVRFGTVSEIDAGAGTARIVLGEDWISDFLPWLAPAAGAVSSWSPPSVGEQVVVLSVSGEPGAGVVLRGLPSNANPAPSADPNRTRLQWGDGSFDEHDDGAHTRTISLPAGGKLTLQVGGSDVLIEDGKLTLQVGGTEILVQAGQVTIAADQVLLGSGSDRRAVARVGDPVSLSTGLILDGSSEVKAA